MRKRFFILFLRPPRNPPTRIGTTATSEGAEGTVDILLLSGGPVRVAVQQQHSSHPDNYSRGTKRLFGISVAFVIKIIDHRSARGATDGYSKKGGDGHVAESYSQESPSWGLGIRETINGFQSSE